MTGKGGVNLYILHHWIRHIAVHVWNFKDLLLCLYSGAYHLTHDASHPAHPQRQLPCVANEHHTRSLLFHLYARVCTAYVGTLQAIAVGFTYTVSANETEYARVHLPDANRSRFVRLLWGWPGCPGIDCDGGARSIAIVHTEAASTHLLRGTDSGVLHLTLVAAMSASLVALWWHVIRFPAVRNARVGTVGYHVGVMQAKKSDGFKRKALCACALQATTIIMAISLVTGKGFDSRGDAQLRIARSLGETYIIGFIGIAGLYSVKRPILTCSDRVKQAMVKQMGSTSLSWLISSSASILEEVEDAMLLHQQGNPEGKRTLKRMLGEESTSMIDELCQGMPAGTSSVGGGSNVAQEPKRKLVL